VLKATFILSLIATFCLGGCGRGESSSTSQQSYREKSFSTMAVSSGIHNPFPGAVKVRLFVEKGYDPDGVPVFNKRDGRLLNAKDLADFEGALRIEKMPEMMAACFVPHHFFRYYDESGKQVGEISVCFCCAGVEASEGAKISIGSDQILSADYSMIKALVLRLGEPTDVLCD
jgi:hypothetical protein